MTGFARFHEAFHVVYGICAGSVSVPILGFWFRLLLQEQVQLPKKKPSKDYCSAAVRTGSGH